MSCSPRQGNEKHLPLPFKAVVLKFWQKYYVLLTIGMGRNVSFVWQKYYVLLSTSMGRNDRFA